MEKARYISGSFITRSGGVGVIEGGWKIRRIVCARRDFFADRVGVNTILEPSPIRTAVVAAPQGQGMSFPLGGSDWALDPSLDFLNHGSYGAVPRDAIRFHAALHERLERDPVRFYKVDLERLMDDWRNQVAGFINCRPADLAPLPNATVGLCTILRNTKFERGDEIVVTDHEYQSLHNELERVCEQTGAKKVVVSIPFPIEDPGVVVERYIAALTKRTKLAFISHVTSATSLVLPVGPIIAECNRRGIDVVLDGAHSPGQIPVDVLALAPTYFVGSGHKWLSGPKGIGFLVVRADKQPGFRPLALSSRANKIRPERALFLRDFDYQGTGDYTNVLTLPASMDAIGRLGNGVGNGLGSGGWPAVMRANHEKVMRGRQALCAILGAAFGVAPAAPESMIGSMATIILPEPAPELAERPTLYDDALQDELVHRHRIVTPVWRVTLGEKSLRVLRISAQLYNRAEQYEHLGHALIEELSRECGGRGLRATA